MLALLLLFAQTPVLPAPDPNKAIRQYNPASAESLLQAGDDPNARDTHARTPLHAAATGLGWGKLELVRLLLAKGADPNARDDTGASPLDEAAWGGSAEKAAVLLDGGAKLNAPETKTGATPLNEAAFKGHTAVNELLLARGANARIKDHAGFSPVENAVRQHRPDTVRVLLAHNKDGDLPNRLLEQAIRLGQADTVQMLLENGAAIDARFASGSTALSDAALNGDNAIVSLLVSRGANANARDVPSGTTPLYAAAAFGREEAVATLLLWGADPNLRGKDGISPLQAAKSNGYRAIAARILSSGGH